MELLLLGLTSEIWLMLFLLSFVVMGMVVSAYDNVMLASLTLIAGLAALQWIFGVPVWASIVANPLIIVLFAAAYIVIGSFYTGLWRFPNFVSSNKLSIRVNFEIWVKDVYRTDTKEQYIANLKSDEKYEEYLDSTYYPMSASKNKTRLASWVLMWPFALTWELSHKPAIWIWDTVYSNLGEVFQQISKRTARNLRNKDKK